MLKFTEDDVCKLVKMCEAVELAQREDSCAFTITVTLIEAMRVAYNSLPLLCTDYLEMAAVIKERDAEIVAWKRIADRWQAMTDKYPIELSRLSEAARRVVEDYESAGAYLSLRAALAECDALKETRDND